MKNILFQRNVEKIEASPGQIPAPFVGKLISLLIKVVLIQENQGNQGNHVNQENDVVVLNHKRKKSES